MRLFAAPAKDGRPPCGIASGGTFSDGIPPGGIASGGSTPGGSTPGGITPGGIAPGGITPGGIAPGGIAPGGIAPAGINTVEWGFELVGQSGRLSRLAEEGRCRRQRQDSAALAGEFLIT